MSETRHEHAATAVSGWLFLPIWIAFYAGTLWQVFDNMFINNQPPAISGFVALAVLVFLAKGFVVLPPNIGAVCTFFGRYAGSLRESGFFWTNPFFQRQRISLRVHNLNTPTLKVNDRAGNPIEVGAVVVWRVLDTARAAFDVEDYETYVAIQSESAVRVVASARWYDGDEHGRNSLRADLDAVAGALADTIQEHVALAGSRSSKPASPTLPTPPKSPTPCAIDPYSSGLAFDGWRDRARPFALPRGYLPLVVVPAESWLLTDGWRRWGPIDVREVPGPGQPG